MASKATKLDLQDMSMEEAIEVLNKRYGVNTIVIAEEAKGVDISHISSGSYALDIGLGGGFPENRIIEIRGPFSSFKSTISLTGGVNFQNKYSDGYILYVDAEKTFDRLYAQRLGVDLSRCVVVNPDSGEQAVDVVSDVLKLPCALWVVLDSVAALVPSAELEGTMQDQFMGLQARLIARAMRVVTSRLKRNLYSTDSPPTTVIALNQLRKKIGVMFGNPETTPGGEAKDFFYSTIVRLHASIAKENVIAVEETRNGIKRKVRYGQRVDFKILKNKCGGPQHEEGDFVYYERDYEGHKAFTFNNSEALFHYGAFLDVITQEDGCYVYGKISYKRESDFIKALDTKPNTSNRLYLDILKKISPSKVSEVTTV